MFSLYIRYARTLHYKKTAANVIFFGCCKGAKIGKTYILTQQPRFNPLFAISKIANRCPYLLPTRKNEKNTKKSHIFCLKVLQIQKKAVSLHRI